METTPLNNINNLEGEVVTINDAVIKGRLDILHKLCKSGFDINERCDTDSSTPLMNSIFLGKDLISIYLIKNGADLTIRDKGGFNLLMISILVGNELISNILIDYGIDINSQENAGITALMMSSSMGQINIVYRLIASGADVNKKNNAGETAFVNAMQEQKYDVAALLKIYGAIE